MPLEPDILERLRHDFSVEEFEKALDLLQESGRTGRLARCIVVASHGEIEKLDHYIRLADFDYRDVIVAGEYEGWSDRIRDLRVSFLIDSKEKMWVSGVADVMASRGYTLSHIESRAASVEPFQVTEDLFEGTAKFEGAKDAFMVEKKDRQWIIQGNAYDLELHDLNHPFEDAKVFYDAVGCYLLTDTRWKPPRQRLHTRAEAVKESWLQRTIRSCLCRLTKKRSNGDTENF